MIDYTPGMRELLEGWWEEVLSFFGHDDKYVMVLGSSMVMLTFFWVTNSFFMILDYTGRPSFLLKYKIQKDKNFPPVDRKRFFEVLLVTIRNEFTTCLYIFLLYPTMRKCGMSCDKQLPPLWRAYVEYTLFGYISEFIFYYSHRLFHHPALYKHIHKKHHEWQAPISIATSYTHPIEHLISNVSTFLVPPLLFGSHISHVWLFMALGQIGGPVHHCNYHFPGMESPQFHDYHHLKFNECYGVSGLLDWVHQTDANFQKSVQGKRHQTFYSLTPIDQQFPAETEKTEKSD